MKCRVSAVCQSLLWGLIILLFPVVSGALSVILSLDTVETLFLQGSFMLLALLPPAVLVLVGKRSWGEIGFAEFDWKGCKSAFYFIPLLVIFVPATVKGFSVRSAGYGLGNLFLYLLVGISEEIYFRGVIPSCLKKGFSAREIVLLSTFIFGIGHIAAALAGSTAFETALTVWNAFIFGWLAMEMTMLSGNILSAVLLHFFFDFETKIVLMDGKELLIAETFRGVFVFIAAVWLTILVCKRRKAALE